MTHHRLGMRLLPWTWTRTAAWLAALLSASLVLGSAARAGDASPGDAAGAAAGSTADAEIEAQARALAKASASVVGVRSVAVEDARSIDTLGREREGSGVVIGPDGLVVTIGYLVLEADHVELVLERDRVVPARVVAYDVASGFGLLQPLAPVKVPAVALGDPAQLGADEPLVIASGGESGDLSVARMVSRRAFSGYWEYHIDGALFTTPPRRDHSGAALFNTRGELLGIGSLVVQDAAGTGRPGVPGNMFVPADLLGRILPELRQRGATALSTRAWLGLNCIETDKGVVVMRVSADSPAEAAGLQPGDRVLRIDGAAVQDLESLYKTLWRGTPAEREVTLVVRRSGEEQTVKVQARDRVSQLRRARGI